MICLPLSRFFSLIISCALLVAPLPLSAIAQDIIENISASDIAIITRHSDESYIYLGKESSAIAQLISDISSLDNDNSSPIHRLQKHITDGFTVGQYDAVIEALTYADQILNDNCKNMNGMDAQKIMHDFEKVALQVKGGLLTIDAYAAELTQAKKDRDVVENKGKRSPPNTMRVQGLLSVNDQTVQNITAVSLSATDAVIQNLYATNISVTDQTIVTLSATDAVITNIDTTNISVVDQSVSGDLSVNDVIVSTYINFLDTVTDYVGIQAPTVVSASYTVSLPSTAPTANQVLRANGTTPTNLEWITEGSSVPPSASETIYVTKYGNDTTGDGSSATPYASLSKAISIANGLASVSNPVAIVMSAGIYVEDNSVMPLAITVAGISIVGESPTAVIIEPNTPANNLLSSNQTTRIANITFQSSSPLATGLSLTAGNLSVLSNVRIINFLIGVSCSGGASQTYGFNTCLFVNNGTAMSVNNTRIECNSCTIFGTSSMAGPAANTGISITGSGTSFVSNGGVFGLCTTGFNITGNALVTISSVNFRQNSFSIVQNGASHLTLSGSTFELTGSGSDIALQVAGAGTLAEIISCEFSGSNILDVTESTGIMVTDSGSVNMSGGTIHNYTTGIQVGLSTDTSSTVFSGMAVIIHDCTTAIAQYGSSTMQLNSCTTSGSAITIDSDATNVILAFFDLDDNSALTIGSMANVNSTLVQAGIASDDNPAINYFPSIYGNQAIGFDNSLLSNPSTWFMLSNDNADLTAITTDRTKISGIQLYSDEGLTVGGTSALRGWDIDKNGSEAALSFNYQNTDTVGQVAVSQYTVMQLDGFNNQLQLPAAGTKIVFDSDTNLYRSSANVLKTDDNFIVGTLTPGYVVITDPSTNQLSSSVTTSTELSYLSGITSSVQTQINSKVAKAGDTMTGTLQLPAGTTALPSLVFTGSTTTGLSANSNKLSFSTNGTEAMAISSTGVVSIDGFSGTAGVVHNDSSGHLSSSLIVNADITPATIANSSLATISSTNTPGYIVVRDGSGNFATNMVTLDGTTTNPTDAATKAYVDSVASLGLTIKNPAIVASLSNVTLSGLQTIDGVTLIANNRVLLVGQTNAVQNGLWLAQSSSWTRPTDFDTGDEAEQAYVLILEGNDEGGSSWVCTTPTAIIDTDPLTFVLFSIPSETTGANVGSGTGLIYQGQSGLTLNFKTLLEGDAYIVITNDVSDVAISTNATSSNTPSTIVARDASGNFSAGTITASLTGSASLDLPLAGGTLTGTLIVPAGTAAAPSFQFTGGTNTGISSATANILSFDTGGVERMNIGSSGVTINAFSIAGVVHNSAAGLLTSSLIVNADVDPAAAIVDTKLATISTAGKVSNSATTATDSNTDGAIVARDSSGNFSASTITASLTGAASLNVLKAGDTMTGALQLPAGTTTTPTLNFTGSPTTGLAAASTDDLSFITAGVEAMAISSAGVVSIDSFILAGVVHNDDSGNLSSSLIVDADVAANAAIVDTKLATINTTGKVANSATTATNLNTANAIVSRDSASNFSAGTITASLNGNATTATTATNFTGSLVGDVTGTQSATVVNLVGGQTAATVAAATVLVDAATNLNTANAIVQRDGTGSFAAQVISMTDGIHSGNLVLSTEPSTSTAGNILKGSSRFIHDFGTSNIFVGINAGNFTTSGSGQNSAFGVSALTANTTGASNVALGYQALIANTVGSNNIAIGPQAGQTITTGSGNVYINADAGSASESSTTRIGTSQTSCYIAGINAAGISGDGVVIDSDGQLGITLSSQIYKHNIEDIGVESASILELRPVSFVYNNDKMETKQYGLIAEEVEELFPAIVARDENGMPYTVRYHMLPALLLNELKKQHVIIQKQQATIEEMKQQYVTVDLMNNVINSLRLEIMKYMIGNPSLQENVS